ncbi:glycine cleavage system aminomethyltransferase GcvT [Chelatococcus sp. SYSU_G07232]|uniref:aminomethyltransferase n=1 Tax=Chelatococcus albus TaxID=3047466 RepID=A0ABT7AEP3_9HYPH|nr:glycine cleavage system aminomethyltransferase GcvT [Chelatococcus sp. SYSU_G07232]MDJ1157847.1 glycine cleavage system aminomethyltransferase GcvT [Chelatococcus sp. SYSU_G07232]
MAQEATSGAPLKTTPLHSRHVALGARMVPFAGYDMPVQYPKGIIAEHAHTREAAGLFDVSHMGQAFLVGPDHETTARALEALVPADILNLGRGKQRYTQLLNNQGGILDDLMVTRPADPAEDGRLMLVVNAACKEADYLHIAANLPREVRLVRADDRALLALQGPKAAAVLARHAPGVAAMSFMTAAATTIAGLDAHVSRSGYTGEDGYEISVGADRAGALWDLLVAEPEVAAIGLGARDSLRLEAGLCLYGHDINQETSPVEAALVWSIQKRRREEGGFPGHLRIRQELTDGPIRLRVGLLPEGRAPAREGTQITDEDGELVGEVTSGGFGPTIGRPIAMGYVVCDFAKPGTKLNLVVRGKPLPATVVTMPFVPHRYKR